MCAEDWWSYILLLSFLPSFLLFTSPYPTLSFLLLFIFSSSFSPPASSLLCVQADISNRVSEGRTDGKKKELYRSPCFREAPCADYLTLLYSPLRLQEGHVSSVHLLSPHLRTLPSLLYSFPLSFPRVVSVLRDTRSCIFLRAAGLVGGAVGSCLAETLSAANTGTEGGREEKERLEKGKRGVSEDWRTCHCVTHGTRDPH